MIIEIQNLKKAYGADEILSDVKLRIDDRDRIGLIGANGSGKTTLLNIIAGTLPCDEGDISRYDKTIGYLRQSSGLLADNSIIDEMRAVFSDLLDIEQKIKELTIQMEKDSSLAKEYARLQTIFEQRDGYQIDIKINTVLNGMGFLNKEHNTKISTLSGGEKTRLAICKLLLTEPQLLILDEPTNHLDFTTLIWLESYLKSYKGALLVVSHDRYFLDALATDICEIYRGKLNRYKGNYTQFLKTKEENFKAAQKQYEKQQHEIAALKEYVARNIARASTADSAKSRRNTLEKMEILKNPKEYTKTISLHFDYQTEPFSDVLTVNDVALYVDDGRIKLLQDICLEVKRGEKIAIVGDNGVGKTTFLKALLNRAFYDGRIRWGRNGKIAYFEQEFDSADRTQTVYAMARGQFPGLTEHELRTALGKMLLSGDVVYKKIGVLSGGERAKLKFALMMLKKANILIFDEPTNHLDLASKDKLDEALSNYTGTIIMVSHDRYLINRVPSKIIEMRKDGIQIYNGKYDDYLAVRREPVKESVAAEPSKADNQYYRSKKQKSEELKRKNEIKKIELKISELEQALNTLEKEVSSGDVASDYVLLNEKYEQMKILQKELQGLYSLWEEYCL